MRGALTGACPPGVALVSGGPRCFYPNVTGGRANYGPLCPNVWPNRNVYSKWVDRVYYMYTRAGAPVSTSESFLQGIGLAVYFGLAFCVAFGIGCSAFAVVSCLLFARFFAFRRNA